MLAGGEIGLGVVLTGLAGAALVCYVAYKITSERRELRKTVQLIGQEQAPMADALESLARA